MKKIILTVGLLLTSLAFANAPAQNSYKTSTYAERLFCSDTNLVGYSLSLQVAKDSSQVMVILGLGNGMVLEQGAIAATDSKSTRIQIASANKDRQELMLDGSLTEEKPLLMSAQFNGHKWKCDKFEIE